MGHVQMSLVSHGSSLTEPPTSTELRSLGSQGARASVKLPAGTVMAALTTSGVPRACDPQLQWWAQTGCTSEKAVRAGFPMTASQAERSVWNFCKKGPCGPSSPRREEEAGRSV